MFEMKTFSFHRDGATIAVCNREIVNRTRFSQASRNRSLAQKWTNCRSCGVKGRGLCTSLCHVAGNRGSWSNGWHSVVHGFVGH